MSVFISGPIPTLGTGAFCFSCILSLNSWVQSACRSHNVDFIDNFNLSWNCASRFKRHGIHPNKQASPKLWANIQHTVHVQDCLHSTHPPHRTPRPPLLSHLRTPPPALAPLPLPHVITLSSLVHLPIQSPIQILANWFLSSQTSGLRNVFLLLLSPFHHTRKLVGRAARLP